MYFLGLIIFILVLVVLIFVHELGHFLTAKFFKFRVDEFAIGFKPTIYQKKIGETTYKINALPIGGYVKIFGEDPEEELPKEDLIDRDRAFNKKPRWQQIIVLFAGCFFNFVLAFFILIFSFYFWGVGVQYDEHPNRSSFDHYIQVIGVADNSPSAEAGIKIASRIFSYEVAGQSFNIQDGVGFSSAILNNQSVNLLIKNPGEPQINVLVLPDNNKIGIEYTLVKKIKLGFFESIKIGGERFVELSLILFVEVPKFFAKLITFQADLDQVSGPIGVANFVSHSIDDPGFLFFVIALISINLGVLNLLPFPALDGGRITILLIESVIRRELNYKFVNYLNIIGFLLLILLMIIITYIDIVKLAG